MFVLIMASGALDMRMDELSWFKDKFVFMRLKHNSWRPDLLIKTKQNDKVYVKVCLKEIWYWIVKLVIDEFT